MRTTITLEADVVAKLREEMRRTGKSFKDTVNDSIRNGFLCRPPATGGQRIKVDVRDLGLRPGFSLDNVGELLDRLEGPE